MNGSSLTIGHATDICFSLTFLESSTSNSGTLSKDGVQEFSTEVDGLFSRLWLSSVEEGFGAEELRIT